MADTLQIIRSRCSKLTFRVMKSYEKWDGSFLSNAQIVNVNPVSGLDSQKVNLIVIMLFLL